MLVDPLVLALLAASLLVSLCLVVAAVHGVRILRHFDLRSGHPRQLALERTTYLVSTMVAYAMGFELLSLFLFIHAGDQLHQLFVGAMCAAGTFNVNSYGYTALLLKLAAALACGVWLILNHTDNQGHDYPLIRRKYRLLLPITALVLAEGWVQYGFFAHMAPNLITSCCGAVFNDNAPTLAASLAHLPPALAQALFWGGSLALVRCGYHFLTTGRGARAFAWIATAQVVIAILAVLSFISVSWYQLPTHHCPFCLLKPEYHRIGLPLTAAVLALGICGLGVGAVAPAADIPSLAQAAPRIQRRLCGAAMASVGVMAAIALWPLLVSDFRLG